MKRTILRKKCKGVLDLGSMIRFIDMSGTEIFAIKDGEKIVIDYEDGSSAARVCQNIDDNNISVDGKAYNMETFLSVIAHYGRTVAPLGVSAGTEGLGLSFYTIENAVGSGFEGCAYYHNDLAGAMARFKQLIAHTNDTPSEDVGPVLGVAMRRGNTESDIGDADVIHYRNGECQLLTDCFISPLFQGSQELQDAVQRLIPQFGITTIRVYASKRNSMAMKLSQFLKYNGNFDTVINTGEIYLGGELSAIIGKRILFSRETKFKSLSLQDTIKALRNYGAIPVSEFEQGSAENIPDYAVDDGSGDLMIAAAQRAGISCIDETQLEETLDRVLKSI